MKISVSENNTIQLEDVFNTITLKSKDGEEFKICMRDSGFEFDYNGQLFFAKEGYLEPFHKSIRDNYLVSELQKHNGETTCSNI
jgi:hypothetical protein